MDIVLAALSVLALLGIIAAAAGAESRDGFDRQGPSDPVGQLETHH